MPQRPCSWRLRSDNNAHNHATLTITLRSDNATLDSATVWQQQLRIQLRYAPTTAHNNNAHDHIMPKLWRLRRRLYALTTATHASMHALTTESTPLTTLWQCSDNYPSTNDCTLRPPRFDNYASTTTHQQSRFNRASTTATHQRPYAPTTTLRQSCATTTLRQLYALRLLRFNHCTLWLLRINARSDNALTTIRFKDCYALTTTLQRPRFNKASTTATHWRPRYDYTPMTVRFDDRALTTVRFDDHAPMTVRFDNHNSITTLQ